MYIMLLKVYHSSFPVFTACTFDWLINGRSLVKTKLNHLINSVLLTGAISNKDSIDTGAKHRSYSVKVHSEKSTVHGTWNKGNKILVCWCQNRLTYVMVLVKIQTLLHFGQFIL